MTEEEIKITNKTARSTGAIGKNALLPKIMNIDISKIFCFIGLHNWYYGNFQTGERSKYTGDHIAVYGRACLNCSKKQKSKNGKFIVIKEWERDG